MKRVLLVILLAACTSAPDEPRKAELEQPKRVGGIVGGTVSRVAPPR